MMTVERRWVDKDLPGVELLDATAYTYDHLVKVIRLAHFAAGNEECDLPARVPECVTAQLFGGLVCMTTADDSRRLHVDVSSMKKMAEGTEVIRRGDLSPDLLRQRYGTFKAPRGDAIVRVLPQTGMAKRMLATDKKLATMAWLIRNDTVVDGVGLYVADDAGMRTGIHRLADRVSRTGADGILLHGEAWWAPPPGGAVNDAGQPIRPSKRPDRREAIWVIGMMRDGRLVKVSRPSRGQLMAGSGSSGPSSRPAGRSACLHPSRRNGAKWLSARQLTPSDACPLTPGDVSPCQTNDTSHHELQGPESPRP